MTEDTGLGRHLTDASQLSNCSINQSLSTTVDKLSKDATMPVRFKIGNRSMKKHCEEDIIAKLNEIKMDNNKSPVSKLNEITVLMKKTIIEYEITFISGTAFSQVFTVRAKNDDIIAYGCGSSKKDAKKNAAIEFLKVMENCDGQNGIASATSNEDHAEKVLEKQLETNPIGVLQELCMSNHWVFPHYKYIEDILYGSKSVEYSVICSLKIFKSTAKGNSKQSAKRQAARILYDKIQCLTPEEKAVLHHNEYETPSEVLLDNNTCDNNNLLKQGMIIPPEVLNYVEMFTNQLKLSKNPSINHLKQLNNTEILRNAVNILDQIGEEEDFSLTYFELKSTNKNVEILVRVATFPLLVNLGTGNTVAEAQESAAYGALNYLKLLLER